MSHQHHHAQPTAAALMLVKQTEAAAAVRKWYELSLRSKLVLTEDEKSLKPPYYIYSQLFQKLRSSLQLHTKFGKGMTYVYYSPRRTGKTTAGLAILECVVEVSLETFEKPIPCKFIDAGSTLRHSMRKAFGVPDGVDDKDFITRLCFKVLEKNPGLPGDAGKYSNSLCQVPPVIVIDNVRSFHITDMDFLEALYKACYEGRILLYIFTDDENIADMICGMNGQSRIRPLEGMFEIEEAAGTNWGIVEDDNAITGKIATGIAWKVQPWNRRQLTRIVTECYKDFDWSEHKDSKGLLVFVENDMLPDSALHNADLIISRSATTEALSMLSLIGNSKYDADDDDDEDEDDKHDRDKEDKDRGDEGEDDIVNIGC